MGIDKSLTDTLTDFFGTKVCKERENSSVNILFHSLLRHLSVCQRGDGGVDENSRLAPGSCAARIARARCRHIRSPILYGKIPRRGNNHPCGKPSRHRTRTFPRPCAHNAPEAAQNAPRSRRARQTARSPTPKGSPHRATGAESSKIGNGSSPGGSRKRGAGRSREVEQSLFWRGKNRSGLEPP